jgi:acylphosphatase
MIFPARSTDGRLALRGIPGEKEVKKRLHVMISGRVQGVFFRASSRDAARERGLLGWVRNLPDGRVEALFEGPEEELAAMLEWCRHGPPGALPESVEATGEDFRGEFEDFRITYR